MKWHEKYCGYDIHAFVDVLQFDLTWDPDEECYDPSVMVLQPDEAELSSINVFGAEDLLHATQQIKTLFGVDVTLSEEMKLIDLLDLVSKQCPDWVDRAEAFREEVRRKASNQASEATSEPAPSAASS